MEYKKLLFIAPAWRESLDPKTGTLVLRAEPDSEGYCETIVTPIPGTEPPQFTYTCLSVTCHGECELQKLQMPDGTTVYFCKCVDGPGSGAKASASRKGRQGGGKAGKKTKSARKR